MKNAAIIILFNAALLGWRTFFVLRQECRRKDEEINYWHLRTLQEMKR